MIKHTFHPSRRTFHIAISPVRRFHRADVARWALSNGMQLDRESLAVITATRSIRPDRTIDTTWTVDSISSFLTWEAPSWCASHGLPTPVALTDGLISYLRYLDATRLLGISSDPLPQLLEEVHDAAGVMSEDTGAVHNGVLIHLMPKKSRIAASPS